MRLQDHQQLQDDAGGRVDTSYGMCADVLQLEKVLSRFRYDLEETVLALDAAVSSYLKQIIALESQVVKECIVDVICRIATRVDLSSVLSEGVKVLVASNLMTLLNSQNSTIRTLAFRLLASCAFVVEMHFGLLWETRLGMASANPPEKFAASEAAVACVPFMSEVSLGVLVNFLSTRCIHPRPAEGETEAPPVFSGVCELSEASVLLQVLMKAGKHRALGTSGEGEGLDTVLSVVEALASSFDELHLRATEADESGETGGDEEMVAVPSISEGIVSLLHSHMEALEDALALVNLVLKRRKGARGLGEKEVERLLEISNGFFFRLFKASLEKDNLPSSSQEEKDVGEEEEEKDAEGVKRAESYFRMRAERCEGWCVSLLDSLPVALATSPPSSSPAPEQTLKEGVSGKEAALAKGQSRALEWISRLQDWAQSVEPSAFPRLGVSLLRFVIVLFHTATSSSDTPPSSSSFSSHKDGIDSAGAPQVEGPRGPGSRDVSSWTSVLASAERAQSVGSVRGEGSDLVPLVNAERIGEGLSFSSSLFREGAGLFCRYVDGIADPPSEIGERSGAVKEKRKEMENQSTSVLWVRALSLGGRLFALGLRLLEEVDRRAEQKESMEVDSTGRSGEGSTVQLLHGLDAETDWSSESEDLKKDVLQLGQAWVGLFFSRPLTWVFGARLAGSGQRAMIFDIFGAFLDFLLSVCDGGKSVPEGVVERVGHSLGAFVSTVRSGRHSHAHAPSPKSLHKNGDALTGPSLHAPLCLGAWLAFLSLRLVSLRLLRLKGQKREREKKTMERCNGALALALHFREEMVRLEEAGGSRGLGADFLRLCLTTGWEGGEHKEGPTAERLRLLTSIAVSSMILRLPPSSKFKNGMEEGGGQTGEAKKETEEGVVLRYAVEMREGLCGDLRRTAGALLALRSAGGVRFGSSLLSLCRVPPQFLPGGEKAREGVLKDLRNLVGPCTGIPSSLVSFLEASQAAERETKAHGCAPTGDATATQQVGEAIEAAMETVERGKTRSDHALSFLFHALSSPGVNFARLCMEKRKEGRGEGTWGVDALPPLPPRILRLLASSWFLPSKTGRRTLHLAASAATDTVSGLLASHCSSSYHGPAYASGLAAASAHTSQQSGGSGRRRDWWEAFGDRETNPPEHLRRFLKSPPHLVTCSANLLEASGGEAGVQASSVELRTVEFLAALTDLRQGLRSATLLTFHLLHSIAQQPVDRPVPSGKKGEMEHALSAVEIEILRVKTEASRLSRIVARPSHSSGCPHPILAVRVLREIGKWAQSLLSFISEALQDPDPDSLLKPTGGGGAHGSLSLGPQLSLFDLQKEKRRHVERVAERVARETKENQRLTEIDSLSCVLQTACGLSCLGPFHQCHSRRGSAVLKVSASVRTAFIVGGQTGGASGGMDVAKILLHSALDAEIHGGESGERGVGPTYHHIGRGGGLGGHSREEAERKRVDAICLRICGLTEDLCRGSSWERESVKPFRFGSSRTGNKGFGSSPSSDEILEREEGPIRVTVWGSRRGLWVEEEESLLHVDVESEASASRGSFLLDSFVVPQMNMPHLPERTGHRTQAGGGHTEGGSKRLLFSVERTVLITDYLAWRLEEIHGKGRRGRAGGMEAVGGGLSRPSKTAGGKISLSLLVRAERDTDRRESKSDRGPSGFLPAFSVCTLAVELL
uniref:Uncharacterized protein n=1 Tax=Chromera velia CCMP2878 TaxID=1169474 RepID=A0A0G4HWX4_9ALVE|eukprot:Cvel_9143.t1-p1 / transcript=Cvel_9143.t1 / gene=Cvel_9143 / organism=Chromera_velia_CCMP2878 / gene_product=hypothetical protein / transcript_product=hypothetical protein / location=Cvel_scaffold520:37162-45434(+) / protein_length=1676 / sequence_SO=supercontig / SO=protein_coding / is_pseudo=false